MIWIVILVFLLSGIGAYFVMKIKVRYRYKIAIDFCALIVSVFILFLSNIKELSVLLLIELSSLNLLGIIVHYLAPLIFNALGFCLSKMKKAPYSPKTYNDFLNDGYRMYFCVHLFTTEKIFLFVIFIASCFDWIK